jgi:hypothetical protein
MTKVQVLFGGSAIILGSALGLVAFDAPEPVRATSTRDFVHIVADSQYSCPGTSDAKVAVASNDVSGSYTVGSAACGISGTLYLNGLVMTFQGGGPILNDGLWEASDPDSGETARNLSVLNQTCFASFDGSTIYLSTDEYDCNGDDCTHKACSYRGTDF